VAPAVKVSPFARTGLLAVVAAGLGAYIYFVESKKPAPTGDDSKPKEKVFHFDKAKVKEIAISSGGSTIALVKEGALWKMTAPTAVLADASAVESITGSLSGLEMDEEVAPSATNLKDFGLESPEKTVVVTPEGGAAETLLLGAKLADGSGVYAKTPDKTRIFTVPSFGLSSLDKKPFDLRDRDLMHVKRDAVKTLAITGPQGSYALVKSDPGEWAFTKPVATLAGRWSVDGLLGTLEGLRMESVAAEDAKDPKKFGLDKPSRTVTLGLADGTTKTLEIGSAAGDKKWNAREQGTGLVAVIPGAIVDDLAKGMGELRSKRLLEVATYETEGFDVVVGGATKTYSKTTVKDAQGLDSAKWKRTAPDAKDLETSKVEDALFKIGAIEVAEFVDQPKGAEAYGLDAPAFTLVIRSGAGKGEQKLELGRKDGAIYARRPGDASILKIDSTKAEDLIKAFSEL
jgi:Domain of unknown function (DUF4340)